MVEMVVRVMAMVMVMIMVMVMVMIMVMVMAMMVENTLSPQSAGTIVYWLVFKHQYELLQPGLYCSHQKVLPDQKSNSLI